MSERGHGGVEPARERGREGGRERRCIHLKGTDFSSACLMASVISYSSPPDDARSLVREEDAVPLRPFRKGLPR